MKKFKEKNMENNVKSSLKLAPVIAVLAGAAVILTGCGNSQGSSTYSGIGGNTAATEAASAEETSVAATETAAETSEVTTEASTADASAPVETTADDTSSTSASSDEEDNEYGIDQVTAVANVREQVGSGAEILSCTKGKAPDTGADCWVIEVAPITNGSGSEKVTYYSGYLFCYTLENSPVAADGSGQNPMMNYIGNYTNGSATMTVSCIGKDEVSITILKENSEDAVKWSMSGPVSVGDESITVSYDNCVRNYLEYDDKKQVKCIIAEYENGSGTVEFLFSDNNAYWHDGVAGVYEGSAFTFSD